MKKSWLARHPSLINMIILYVLVGAGVALGRLINTFYFLLGILGLAVYIGGFILIGKWVWVCSKCGKEESWGREKYCRACGGEMTLKRAKMLVKYCVSGHRIKNSNTFTEACPKCGKPFQREAVELK